MLPGPTAPWVTLAGLALETTRIRIGSLMSVATFRYPGVLAVEVAQVDQMSGGRLELGMSLGARQDEHESYGIPFPPVSERFDRLDEQLTILDHMWSTPPGQHFDYEGTYFKLTKCPALPKPAQPRIPVIIGGHGANRTPALAARHADEFNVGNVTPQEARQAFERVRHECRALRRDPASMTFSVLLIVCCGRTDGELATRRRSVGALLDQLGNGEDLLTELGPAVVTGLPGQCAEALRSYFDAGADRIYLQMLDLHDLGSPRRLRV